MEGKTHVPTGFLAGAGLAAAAGQDTWTVLAAGLVAAGTSAGPLSPDVDQTATVARVRRTLAAVRLPRWLPGHLSGAGVPWRWLNHREATHWIGWPVLLALAVVSHAPEGVRFVWLAACLGWGTHIAGDFVFGRTGIPVLPGVRLGLGLTSGGWVERRIARPVIVALSLWVTVGCPAWWRPVVDAAAVAYGLR